MTGDYEYRIRERTYNQNLKAENQRLRDENQRLRDAVEWGIHWFYQHGMPVEQDKLRRRAFGEG